MAVGELFEKWLTENFPDRRPKVLIQIRAIRRGELNESAFGRRMRGTGIFAQQMYKLFAVACWRAGLAGKMPELSTAAFRRWSGAQLEMF
jgi:hypothetical protein